MREEDGRLLQQRSIFSIMKTPSFCLLHIIVHYLLGAITIIANALLLYNKKNTLFFYVVIFTPI